MWFMPHAERNDLAGNIDRHMIPGLLKTMVDVTEKQVINLSTISILDYAFPGWFAAQTNLRPAQRLMKELKPLGCSLSISQFDDERRSLQLLDHIGASYIKLKPELTTDLISNSKNQEAIRKIVDAAQAHDIEVIADEVADTSSLAVLWQCGVKLIAGAFLSDSSQVIAQ